MTRSVSSEASPWKGFPTRSSDFGATVYALVARIELLGDWITRTSIGSGTVDVFATSSCVEKLASPECSPKSCSTLTESVALARAPMASVPGVPPYMPPAVPATLERYLCTNAITGTFELHSSVPKTSPAGTVTDVTSGKNFVSRGNSTIGAELTAAPAGAPLAAEG